MSNINSNFNYNLVLLGRQLRKITQAGLAKSISITQGHLSKIENGLIEPTDAIIIKMAEILKFPQDFFYQSDRVYGLPISIHLHRKKASVRQQSLESIDAELNIRLMHLRRLLKAIDFDGQFEMPKIDIDEYHGDVERIAELVRQTWLLPRGPLQNLTECIEQAGCIISLCNFSTSLIDGFSCSVPGLPPCIFLNQNQPSDRMRFTLAHELGHLVMHRQILEQDMEDHANEFASAFLMPLNDIKGDLNGRINLPRLASLKPIWRVSIQSLVMRAFKIGVISPNQNRYLWQQINFSKFRYQEPTELDFAPEEPKILPMLFKIYIEKLQYSTEEIAKVLNIMHSELLMMYPFLNDFQKRKLHLVN
jgi:Zn-dependent peptidase ImmA (M78 family)/DNA-binding XRE family transcriptional regulator